MRKALGGTILSAALVWGLALPAQAMPTENGSSDSRSTTLSASAVSTSRTPVGLPVELPGDKPKFTTLTRGAEQAQPDEVERNPRAGSVRLRAVQRVQAGPIAASRGD